MPARGSGEGKRARWRFARLGSLNGQCCVPLIAAASPTLQFISFASFVTGVFGLPAVCAGLLSRKVYRALKKKESKWKWPAAIGVFLATYLITMCLIFVALLYAGFFHR